MKRECCGVGRKEGERKGERERRRGKGGREEEERVREMEEEGEEEAGRREVEKLKLNHLNSEARQSLSHYILFVGRESLMSARVEYVSKLPLALVFSSVPPPLGKYNHSDCFVQCEPQMWVQFAPQIS